MRNLYIYLSIFLAVKITLLVAIGIFLHRRGQWFGKKRMSSATEPKCEQFNCVKTNLRRINENFYVAQIIFANKQGSRLVTQGEGNQHSAGKTDRS